MLPDSPVTDAVDARARARQAPLQLIFDYIDGAAGQGDGEADNRRSLRAIRLQLRILRDVGERSLVTQIFGQDYDLPFGVAPMGTCNLAWPGADLMLARLAAAENIPCGVSTVASNSLEALLTLFEGRAWFQLYYSGDGSGTLRLMERARDAGYQTLVLTVDVPEVGCRPWEVKKGFRMPFRIGARAFTDFALNPRWSMIILMIGILVVAGCEMETRPNVVILAQILKPLADKIEMTEIQFCVKIITALGVVFIAPPLGLKLFVVSGLTEKSVLKIAARAVPFVFFMLLVVLLIALVSQMSTFLLPEIYK